MPRECAARDCKFSKVIIRQRDYIGAQRTRRRISTVHFSEIIDTLLSIILKFQMLSRKFLMCKTIFFLSNKNL